MSSNGRRRPFSASPPQILSIAGSDPSGGAGIQADLKTFSSLGCYGMSVITSLTAQNTLGVTQIHIPPVEFFKAQLNALWEDIEIDAIKVGMLGNRDIILALSDELRLNARQVPIVLDPVMVSTSGSLLLTEESIQDLVTHLLPLCTLLTPNLPEARQLLSHAHKGSSKVNGDLSTVESLFKAAKELCHLGPKATLVKGGHQVIKASALEHSLSSLGLNLESQQETSTIQEQKVELLGAEVYSAQWQQSKVTVIRTDEEPYADILRRWSTKQRQSLSDPNIVLDILYEKKIDEYTLFVKPHIESTATHGTGCTLSSALAVHLATSQNSTLAMSTRKSIQYVQHCISRGLTQLGKGSGPLHHLCHTTARPVLAPAATGPEQVPLCSRLIAHSLPFWRAFTRHPFLQQLGTHSLPSESFIYFLKQDFLFLKNYARVWASGASSFTIGSTFQRIAMFAGIATEMAAEADNHVKICTPWGITKDDLEHNTVESAATLAYTRFVLDVSRSGDALELLAATGPCLLGYGEAGLRLASSRKLAPPKTAIKGYDQWIDYYSGEEFQKVVQQGIENMEEYADSDPPSGARMASLQRIWNAAVRLEIGMWDEALDPQLRRDILDP